MIDTEHINCIVAKLIDENRNIITDYVNKKSNEAITGIRQALFTGLNEKILKTLNEVNMRDSTPEVATSSQTLTTASQDKYDKRVEKYMLHNLRVTTNESIQSVIASYVEVITNISTTSVNKIVDYIFEEVAKQCSTEDFYKLVCK